MIEFPAGKLDAHERGAEGTGAVPGATPGVWSCATRELAEETGYTAAQWAYAGGMHNAIAYSDEIIHICFARGLTRGEQRLDEGEFLSVGSASFDELMADVMAARLTDAKTCTALLWWQQLKCCAWHPTWHDVGNLPMPTSTGH
jgi:ADP-ribose pyrophosphatase